MAGPTPAVNRIAFINGQGELCTIAPDGTDLRALSRSGRQFQAPAWSPVGDRIAAVGASQDTSGVFVFDDGLPEPVGPLHGSRVLPPIYVSWSPDGQWLTYAAVDSQQESMILYLTRPEMSRRAPRKLTTGRPCFWDWSPDSRNILVHTGVAGDDAKLMYLAIGDGSSRVVQNSIARPGLFQSPAISRNGRYWAFGDLGEEGELRVIIDGGGSAEPLAAPHVGVAAMSWSPRRDQLAFISPGQHAQHCYGELRLVDALTGGAEVLSEQTVVAFFWSPDGARIAYLTVKTTPNSHAELLGLDDSFDAGGAHVPGDLDALLAEKPEPAGRRLKLSLWVLEVDSGRRQLLTTFVPVDSFIEQFLPFFDQYARSHRVWSPDSSALVLPMMFERLGEDDEARVVVVPADGSPRRVLGVGSSAFWSWR